MGQFQFDPTLTLGNVLTILVILGTAFGAVWRMTLKRGQLEQNLRMVKGDLADIKEEFGQVKDALQILAVIQQRIADGQDRMCEMSERLTWLERRSTGIAP